MASCVGHVSLDDASVPEAGQTVSPDCNALLLERPHRHGEILRHDPVHSLLHPEHMSPDILANFISTLYIQPSRELSAVGSSNSDPLTPTQISSTMNTKKRRNNTMYD